MMKLSKGTFRHGRERGMFAGILALPVAIFVFAFAPQDGSFALSLQNALGPNLGTGYWVNVWATVIALLIATLAAYVLLGAERKAQSYITWGGLALLALFLFNSFDLSYDYIMRKLPFLLWRGAVTTLYVSAISIILAFVFALSGAIAKMSGIGILEGVGGFYTSYFRGVPLLVQLFLIYMGLPQIGYIVQPLPAAITALSLVYGAYMTEIFRSGIESIHPGQWEAADALGLTRMRTFRKVILPQALRVIIPPTGNQFIAMLKDSSLVSVVGVWDIMFIARTTGRSDYKTLEMLITASIVYWILSIILEIIQRHIENYYGKSQKR
ncbi:amino acid ABC transporter permease [uncultured Cohaesibacter sp.]|uniref:amino acid ABC transporter permease n=1 Tax=uncultured Cohaesibacter sp. TaxID=1002546 RepID=UPI00292E3891|nr:amino acid ABC transporter permease [uncultured Cohaesibacter sp.]